MENKSSKIKQNTLMLFYRFTHYMTYKSFRRGLSISRFFVWAAFVILIVDALMPDPHIQNMAGIIVMAFLVFYTVSSYFVFAKAKQLRQDSEMVMRKIAFEGKVECKAWNVYNGIYNDGNNRSVEITFTKERALLTNLICILRKKDRTLPLTQNDIENLKDYLQIIEYNSTEDKNYVAYATLSDEMAYQLQQSGVDLMALPPKYENKPLRWDFACANGKINCAFMNYPRRFGAYVMSVKLPDDDDEDYYDDYDEDNGQYINLGGYEEHQIPEADYQEY